MRTISCTMTTQTPNEGNTSRTLHQACDNNSHSLFVTLDPVFMLYYYGTLCLVALVNIVGNCLVLRTIYRHRSLWEPCNVFICSLATSDLMFGVIFPLYNVAAVTSIFGVWPVCRWLLTEVLALEICSAWGLVAITLTRYVNVTWPFSHHQYVTNTRATFVVIGVWLTSHAGCIGFYATKIPAKVMDGSYCDICRFEQLYSLLELMELTIVQFGLPCVVLIAVYFRMAYMAKLLNRRVWSETVRPHGVQKSTSGPREASSSMQSGDSGTVPSPSGRGSRTMAVVALLLGCFCLSYLPMIIYFFLVIVMGQSVTPQYEYYSATCRIFLFLNTAVNVFIYAGRMPKFKDCLRRDFATTFSRPKSSKSRCCSWYSMKRVPSTALAVVTDAMMTPDRPKVCQGAIGTMETSDTHGMWHL